MIIDSISIKNFRAILNETLFLEQLTALIGANGAGKSSFLRGLELFYTPSPKIDFEDFYNCDTSTEIEIAISFKNLSNKAKELFSSYMQGDLLRVERVFKKEDSGKITDKYYGATLQCPDFAEIREALKIKDRGKTARNKYEAIRLKPEYSSLPTWPSTLKEVPEIIKNWEVDHPDICDRARDDGQFFGFKEVGQGYLGKFTRFLFIPAVRDASDDAAEGRGSVLTDLMDLVVRSIIANKKEVQELREETKKQYEEIMDPVNLKELSSLAKRLSKTLKTFVPDALVDLHWLPLEDKYSNAKSRH